MSEHKMTKKLQDLLDLPDSKEIIDEATEQQNQQKKPLAKLQRQQLRKSLKTQRSLPSNFYG